MSPKLNVVSTASELEGEAWKQQSESIEYRLSKANSKMVFAKILALGLPPDMGCFNCGGDQILPSRELIVWLPFSLPGENVYGTPDEDESVIGTIS